MGTTNVLIWIEVEDEETALDVSEQVADLLETYVVRKGVRVKGITQEAPDAACGLACEGPRRIQGVIEEEPANDIFLHTVSGERIGLLEFLRKDGTPSVAGRAIKVEVLQRPTDCTNCSTP